MTSFRGQNLTQEIAEQLFIGWLGKTLSAIRKPLLMMLFADISVQKAAKSKRFPIHNLKPLHPQLIDYSLSLKYISVALWVNSSR